MVEARKKEKEEEREMKEVGGGTSGINGWQ